MWAENAGEVPLPGTAQSAGRLFVGNLAAASGEDGFFAAVGVTHVLTAAGRLNVAVPEEVRHLALDLADHPMADVLAELPKCLEFLDAALNEGGVVLVHCASGVSRSAAVCTGWLLSNGVAAYDDALAMVRTNRPGVGPNIGFTHQLQQLAAAGGDVRAARRQWSATHAEAIMEEARMQRDAANDFHRRLDEVEDAMAAAAAKASFIPQLSALADAVDDGVACPDRVARTVWKAAREKLRRLLDVSRGAVLAAGPGAVPP